MDITRPLRFSPLKSHPLYGMEDDEEYEALYPTREEVCGEFDED